MDILDYLKFLLMQIVASLYVNPWCSGAKLSRNNRNQMDGSYFIPLQYVSYSSPKYKTFFCMLLLSFVCF